MKKNIFFILIISLLSFFCACEKDESQTQSQSLILTAEIATESTEEYIFEQPEDFYEVFTDYNSFSAALHENFPNNYEHPIPDSASELKIDRIILSNSYYQLFFTDPSNDISFSVEMRSDTFLDEFSDYLQHVTGEQYNPPTVALSDNQYAILNHNERANPYMVGLTKESNVIYYIYINSETKSDSAIVALEEYREILGL